MSIKRRDPLGESQKQKKYAKPSLKNGGLQISRAIEDDYDKAINKFERAKTASIEAAKTWNPEHNVEHVDAFPAFDDRIGNYSDMYRDRRICIKYLYIVIFGAPPQDMWHDMRLIPAISAILDIDSNSYTRVNCYFGRQWSDAGLIAHRLRLE